MKLALVTPYFSQPRGNTVTVQRLADALEANGVEVSILSIEDNHYPELPDVDLVHGFNAYQFFHFWEKSGAPDLPYVLTLTGTDLNHSLFSESTKRAVVKALDGAKAVHVFNEKAKGLLLQEVPDLVAKTFLIPQGMTTFPVDPSLCKKEQDIFVFLLPAGLRRVKNVPQAIEMLTNLHQKYPSFRLWLVGPIIEEAEGERVKKLVKANSDWIKYLGQVPHDKMGEIYSCSDIVLNTSLSEGQSSAILEAMACGLPVVASDIPGNRDLISDQETGFLYKDDVEFYQVIEALHEKPELRTQVSEQAKTYVEEHHSVKKEVNDLLHIYKTILGTAALG